MILHLSQIFLTDALTFINQFSVPGSQFSENHSAGASPALQNLFVAIYNPPAIQVVGRKLDRDFVSRQYADEVLPHLPGNMRQHLVFVFQLHLEHGIRQRLEHHRHHFNRVLFTHRPPRSSSQFPALSSQFSVKTRRLSLRTENRELRTVLTTGSKSSALAS